VFPGFGEPAFAAVTADHLRTMQLTMRAGRWIREADESDGSAEVRVRRCASSSVADGDIPTRDAFYSERLSVLLRKIEFLCSAVITPENGLNNLAGLE
jgi:hypothetical protein